MDDFQEIAQTVAKSTAFAGKCAAADTCKCGAKWQRWWEMQAIGYNPDEQCMCDFFVFRCENHDFKNPNSCQEKKKVIVPLRGGPYQKMAAAVKDSLKPESKIAAAKRERDARKKELECQPNLIRRILNGVANIGTRLVRKIWRR